MNNSILETNLTIMTAFLTFYAAEMWELDIGGILSLVAFGLYMTKVGKTTISQNSEETLHIVSQYL
jgi:NhaP-type Na+/H+ or K+/H+ antiporter